MIYLNALLLMFLQAVAPANLAEMPIDPGVYFQQDDSRWIRLHPAVFSDAGARGFELFVYTAGYTDLGMVMACPGARAAVRVPVQKPTLYVRAAGPVKDAVIIRLAKKKNKRAIESLYSNVTVENKGGFRKDDIYRLVAGELPDGSFSLTPEKKLPPGEYLLAFGNAATAYDFGVDGGK